MPDPTPQEREQWQAACDAATDGPWIRFVDAGDGGIYINEASLGTNIVYVESVEEASQRDLDNAAFIACARTALPRLLAAWDAQERTIDSLRGECALVHGANHHLGAENTRLLAALTACEADRDGARYSLEQTDLELERVLFRLRQTEAECDRLRALGKQANPLLSHADDCIIRLQAGACDCGKYEVQHGFATQPPLPDPTTPHQRGLLEPFEEGSAL